MCEKQWILPTYVLIKRHKVTKRSKSNRSFARKEIRINISPVTNYANTCHGSFVVPPKHIGEARRNAQLHLQKKFPDYFVCRVRC